MHGLVYGSVAEQECAFLVASRATSRTLAPSSETLGLRLRNNVLQPTIQPTPARFQPEASSLSRGKLRGKSNMRRRKSGGISRPERITVSARADALVARE